MLYISSPIHNFFELVLINFSNLILDCIYKGSRLFKAIVEEKFEVILYNKPNGYAFNFLFILMLTIQGLIFHKNSYKRDPILAFSFIGCKMIFTILTKVRTLHIGLSLVYIRQSNL